MNITNLYLLLLRRFIWFLLKTHNSLYKLLSLLAIKAENGLHPKHRLTRYHDFFVNNIKSGDTVLDVGCGNGQVLLKVASRVEGCFKGVDISANNIKAAKVSLGNIPNVELVCSDIWEYEDNSQFDVIIMSNVLEHLENRPKLLNRLVRKFRPKRMLIRVPMFERDWLVPYKKEFGVEWRLDSTHETEYTDIEMRQELAEAGLQIESIAFRWSEIYIKAVPSGC